jgi:hypothetical protein
MSTKSGEKPLPPAPKPLQTKHESSKAAAALFIPVIILVAALLPLAIIPALRNLSASRAVSNPLVMAPVWTQKTFQLPAKSKGCYLITSDVTSQLSAELKDVKVGLLHLFLQHTSAALTLNENWDSDVRKDMVDALDRVVPEEQEFRHDAEGSDDMPVSFPIPN